MLPERKKYLIKEMPPQITEQQRQALYDLDTGTLGHYLEAGFMDSGMKQQSRGTKVAGTAVTVRITVPDSVLAHYALKFIRPGDILVIDRGQDQQTACWGAATSYAAVAAGLSGLLIDGTTTDIADAEDAGLPIWCRGLCPVTTKYRGLGGEMNIAVNCGGVAVNAGDAILADDNGIVVISPEQLDDTIKAGQAWQTGERDFLKALRENPDMCYPDATGASAIVEANLVE